MMDILPGLEKMLRMVPDALIFLDQDPEKKKTRNVDFQKKGEMFVKKTGLLNTCLASLGLIPEKGYTHLAYTPEVELDGVVFTVTAQNSLVDDDNEYDLWIGIPGNERQMQILLEKIRQDWGVGGSHQKATPEEIRSNVLIALRQIGYINEAYMV